MRILIVEDDKTLRGNLHQALSREGYSVDDADVARQAAQLAAENTYDIILMDIGMPGQDGHWLLKTLRERRNNALVFMMTGRADEENKVTAYENGADDYIVKPFHIAELAAKIRAWLKRRHDFLASEVQSTILTVGDLRLNLLKRHAVREDRIIPLTRKEFELLEYFMRHPGRILSQQVIAEHVWNTEYDKGSSNVVEAQIKNLRAKIDGEAGVKLIKTMRGSGYMIEAPE